jgi:membrane fusion protein, multidrug efflux system
VTDPSNGRNAPARSWFRRLPPVPLAISLVVLVVLAGGGLLLARSTSRVNKVPLSAEPKGVATGTAVAANFQPIAHYVGTVEPWIEARLGPQFVAAYVDTILVRPGAAVRKGQILGTLDCRNASAESKAVAAQARAIEARQEALAHEASRVGGLLAGGFVSPNEAEQKNAESASKEAELQSTRAKLVRSSLEVDDCILRAPFDGEVGAREMDPGAFARPGTWALSVVDRSVLRIVTDVPEADFANVAPGTPVKIRITSTGAELTAKISRRSPAADRSTRTIHFEIDVPDPGKRLPVYTTAELSIEAGKPIPATEIPLTAATIRGEKATVMTVEGGVAHKKTVEVVGEGEGRLFVGPSLAPGTVVVTEGRGSLQTGDRVKAAVEASLPSRASRD